MYRNSVRKTAEEWNDWKSEEQKWRDEGYQEQMLHHMSAEKCVGETIERRSDGEPDGSEAKKEERLAAMLERGGSAFCE